MRSRHAVTFAAGVLVLPALFAGSAHAAGTTARGFGPITPKDSNWGGYVATSGGYTSISGSWTEPSVTCNSSNDLFAPWIGLDGDGSSTVEQTGVQADCSSGSPAYSAWYEMYPASPVYFKDPVSAGDVFKASVTSDGSGSYKIELSDTTKGWTENTTQQLSSAKNASAEAVIEDPSGSYPKFSKIDFTGVTVNGKPFAQSNPQKLDSGGYTETALNGGDFSIVPASSSAAWLRAHNRTGPRPAHIRY